MIRAQHDTRSGTRRSRIVTSPTWLLLVGSATIVSAVVAIAGITIVRHDDSEVSTLPSATSSPQVSPPRNATDSPSGYQVGACLTSAHVETSCTGEHQFEVISESACSRTLAVTYLGGDPLRDILLVSPTQLRVSSTVTRCVVADPRGVSYEPARNALRGGSSGRWRRCLDTRSAPTVVACSELHTGEYVGVEEGTAADGATCRAAATDYMRTSLERVSDHIAVDVIPTKNVHDGRPRCLLRVLGADVLTDTLRGIGVRALPLSSS